MYILLYMKGVQRIWEQFTNTEFEKLIKRTEDLHKKDQFFFRTAIVIMPIDKEKFIKIKGMDFYEKYIKQPKRLPEKLNISLKKNDLYGLLSAVRDSLKKNYRHDLMKSITFEIVVSKTFEVAKENMEKYFNFV